MEVVFTGIILGLVVLYFIIREENNKHHIKVLDDFFSMRESKIPRNISSESYEMTEETLTCILNGKSYNDSTLIVMQIEDHDKKDGFYTIAWSGGWYKIGLGKIIAWYEYIKPQVEFNIPISISGFYDYYINDTPMSTKKTEIIEHTEPDKLKIPIMIHDACCCVLKFIVDGKIYTVIPYTFTETMIGEEKVYFIQYPKTDDTLNIGKHMLEIVADFHPSENSDPYIENITLVSQEVEVA